LTALGGEAGLPEQRSGKPKKNWGAVLSQTGIICQQVRKAKDQKTNFPMEKGERGLISSATR
jgi:hypothetical protein